MYFQEPAYPKPSALDKGPGSSQPEEKNPIPRFLYPSPCQMESLCPQTGSWEQGLLLPEGPQRPHDNMGHRPGPASQGPAAHSLAVTKLSLAIAVPKYNLLGWLLWELSA